MMEGAIEVDRLMTWMRRQRGMSEWIALKEYWKASEQDKPVVMALYGKTLSEALRKYRKRYKR